MNRVKKCRPTDYYAVLDIESAATEGEIRKAYRKLALIMHPDKNGAPGADEAFKMVSKAFQVLSDPDKKRIFDQTGSDPDSRGGGGGGFSRAAAGGAAGMDGSPFGQQVSPEDLFNLFFGGGGGGGGPFAQFGGQFGGPGVRIHTFGGGNPFQQHFTQARARQQNQNAEEEVPELLSSLFKLLPLLLLFIAPLLSSVFNGGGNYGINTNAHFEFHPSPPYTEYRTTSTYNIPYYVNPREVRDFTPRNFAQLDKRAEVSYVRTLRVLCSREYDNKQQQIANSQGWFSTDQEAYDKAININLEHCEELDKLGLSYTL